MSRTWGLHFARYRPIRVASTISGGGGMFSLPGSLGSLLNATKGLGLVLLICGEVGLEWIGYSGEMRSSEIRRDRVEIRWIRIAPEQGRAGRAERAKIRQNDLDRSIAHEARSS